MTFDGTFHMLERNGQIMCKARYDMVNVGVRVHAVGPVGGRKRATVSKRVNDGLTNSQLTY